MRPRRRPRPNQGVRRLKTWHVGMKLLTEVYRLTRRLPADERYVLTAQLRRAALSIPANLAEGNERATVPDRRHFLTNAKGSAGEIDTLLEAIFELEYLDEDELRSAEDLVDEIGKMLRGMIRNVKPNPP